MPAFALTIFAGAFLLFQVQPLMGKYILPWFGGAPGVWTTCMLFFQVLLLGGYAYAHFAARWLKPRPQMVLHLVLLAAALAWLPIIPSEAWKPLGGGQPAWQILLLLTATLGLPYFVLSSTGPLVQHWFSRLHPGRSPYRLYALSNVGSLLALVSYPFYFETHFSRQAQATLWGWGLVGYVLCCAWCVVKVGLSRPQGLAAEGKGDSLSPTTGTVVEAGGQDAAPGVVQQLLWLLLPGCASVLLLATTNKMCQDVAVIPFLWVLPLALYLLTFIVAFDSPRWYVRFPAALALIAALGGICWALQRGSGFSIYQQVGLYSGGLFFCCLVCHGELYRLRPHPRNLTAFYLMIAAGGALGGLFVALIAPRLFKDYYELDWGLFLCAVLFLAACLVDRSSDLPSRTGGAAGDAVDLEPRFRWDSWRLLACVLPVLVFGGLDRLIVHIQYRANSIPSGYFAGLRMAMWAVLGLLVLSWVRRKKYRSFRHWRFLVCLWLLLGVIGLGATLWSRAGKSERAIYTSRNFYGVLTVYEHRKNEPEGHHFLLQHGRITHGLQFVEPERRMWPTTYYGEESGVGLALQALPPAPRRIGLVGLGTGTLTAYGRKGDEVRLYEINPQVKELALTRFSFLSNSPAKAEVILGDARLSLEREPAQEFDLLALDAFSSDAIPVHLLTAEAFRVYERHLKTNGVFAIHISNHYLDLEPVVVNLARHFHYDVTLVDYDDSELEWWLYSSTWMLLSRNSDLLHSAAIRSAAGTIKTNTPVPLWTDDFASLFQILKK